MTRVIRLMVALFLMMRVTADLSFAQSETVSPYQLSLDELLNIKVTTASRGREQRISEAPSAMYVVTAEDIRQSGVTTIPDALRMVPGLHVFNISPAQVEVGIRGFSKVPSNKIKLLLNSQPMVLSLYDLGKYDLLPVNMEDIERIEVMSGPGSVGYGSGAFLGVINIITKSPVNFKGGYTSFSGGSPNTMLGTLGFGIPAGEKSGFRASAGFNQVGEWGDIMGIYADDLAYRLWKFNTALDIGLGGSAVLSVFGGYTTGDDEFTTRTSGIGDMPGISQYNLAATLRSNHLRFSVSHRAFEAPVWKTAKGTAAYWITRPSHFLENDRQTLAEGEYFIELGKHSLLLGAGHSMLSVNSDFLMPPNGYSDTITSGWAEDTFRVLPWMHINGGYRYDTHSSYGNSGTYRGGFIFPLADGHHTLRVTYGTSMRYPDYVEGHYGPQSATTVFEEATGLKPEKASSAEIGYIMNVNKLNLTTNIFLAQIEDFIGFRYSAYVAGVRTGRAYNLGNADEIGAEVSAKYPLTSWLTGSVNYTHLEARKLDTAVPDDYIDATPQNMANLELRARVPGGLSLNVQGHYVDNANFVTVQNWDGVTGNEVGGLASAYLTMNARIGYAFDFFGNSAELAVSGFNVLNAEHDEYPVRNAQVARSVISSFSVKF